MPKNIDGVSLPERRKSIRNIPIPEGRRRTDRLDTPAPAPAPIGMDGVRRTVPPILSRLETETLEPSERPLPPRPVRSSRKTYWLSLGGAFVLLAFAILSLFKGATLTYTPKSVELSFTGQTYSAYKTGATGLLYSVVKLSGDKGVAVPASGESDVSRKASGTIIVYNDASADPQTLVTNTRFESADGKVYRVTQGITIPGKKGTTPGSIEAVVTADQPGQSYNIALTDFTLPGLKGTPRAATIYARSKTPMTGGYIGKERTVNGTDLAKAKASLEQNLRQDLLAKAAAEVPPDFILFPTLSTVTYEDMPQTPAETSGDALVNMRGTLYGIMFKKADLATALSLGQNGVLADDHVELQSLDALQVAFAGTAPTDLATTNKIDFTVSGTSLLVWQTDEVALKADLAGRSTSDLQQVLKNYPTVKTATATIRPFWKSSFPAQAADITVKKTDLQ